MPRPDKTRRSPDRPAQSSGPAGGPGLEGSIERISFRSDDDGFTVARLMPRGGRVAVTVVGRMPNVGVGATVRLWGKWIDHQRYGRQFEVDAVEELLPATLDGIKKYLGSGLIRGVGPVTAGRIVDHFGLKTLEILDSDPSRLREVPHVGQVRSESIAAAWEEQRQIKAIMLFLQSHGVSTSLAIKIHKRYGDEAARIVREDPYQLARDVHGIGFLTADRIAGELGIARDSPRRMEAGVHYALERLADQGHVLAERAALAAEATELLEVAAASVDPAIDRLAAMGEVVCERVAPGVLGTVDETNAVYLARHHRAEVAIAGHLRQLTGERSSRLTSLRDIDWEAALRWLDSTLPQPLAARQREAVVSSLTHKVCLLTGGPGTGKTTTVRAILTLLRTRGGSVLLAAPTGRAAKRLGEATGLSAKTIHRLLEVQPREGFRFARNADNPLAADLVVIDEVSMVDNLLMSALVRAVDPESHLLLVGDPDQLPSVGAGNVLHDLLASGALHTVTLDHIFRQARESLIVTNAHRINRGEMPVLAKDEGDFYLFRAEDQESAAERVVDVVANRIPARFGLDPVTEVQVLSPMHRGAAGVSALNDRLQQRLNPPEPGKPQAKYGNRVLRVGDKVMQTRNNYSKEVFNGDLGRVVALDSEEHTVGVEFDRRLVTYELSELDELMLAFACSTHKSQGAEYPAVVMALLPAHYLLLQRNLLYTGVTRAQRLCVLVGSPKAIAMAVRNDRVAERSTLLAHRLADATKARR